MSTQRLESPGERTGAPQRAQPQSSQSGGELATHPLVALGQHVGNAAINRMLAQRAAAPDEQDEDELVQPSRDPALQRDTLPEVGPEGGPVSEATAGRINRMRGGGSALDAATRARMEGALGDNFADVRVHTGGEAAQLNRSLGARAFATGSDLFFGAGASPSDTHLLAHELTHVTQQRGMAGGGPLSVGAADDAYEAQAEAAAQAVSSGAAPAQRQADENLTI